jgi:periplasmic divalent cation tolerance protein
LQSEFSSRTQLNKPRLDLKQLFARLNHFAVAKIFPAVYSTGMKTAKFSIVLVTTPDLKSARRLAKVALTARLIACANLVPKVESHYRWKGQIEHGAEVLLILKTTAKCLAKLEKLILAEHPYDTPEFIVLTLNSGNRHYLDWIESSCHPGKR